MPHLSFHVTFSHNTHWQRPESVTFSRLVISLHGGIYWRKSAAEQRQNRVSLPGYWKLCTPPSRLASMNLKVPRLPAGVFEDR